MTALVVKDELLFQMLSLTSMNLSYIDCERKVLKISGIYFSKNLTKSNFNSEIN